MPNMHVVRYWFEYLLRAVLIPSRPVWPSPLLFGIGLFGPAVRPRSKPAFGRLWASPYLWSYTLGRIQNITWPAAWGQDPPDIQKRKRELLNY